MTHDASSTRFEPARVGCAGADRVVPNPGCRQPAAVLRRAVLRLRQADDRRRHRGHRRGRTSATFGAHTVARMIEDVCEQHVRRRRPVPHRGALARRVRARLLRTGPTSRWSACSARIEIAMLGHRRQGGRAARARPARRPRCASGCAPTPTCIRRTGDATDVYIDPELGRRARRGVRRARLHRGQVRPCGRLRDARSAPAVGLRCSSAASATSRAVREAVGDRAAICSSARTASSRRRARSGSRAGSSRSTRSGSRSRRRRRLPEEMARVARATSIPIATGERLTTKHEFARVLAAGAASILQPNLGRVGGLLEAKKIAAHGRGALRADRAAPVLRPGRGCGERPARRLHPELPDPRGHPATGAASTPSCCRRRSGSRTAT